jgi:putative FmdB family regulatory protein
MPIYEYKCESCSVVLEKLQKISDAPLRDCPECGKSTLVKLVSAPSFRLKGSGWYETDFKTGKKKNGAGTDGATNSGTNDGDAKSGAAAGGGTVAGGAKGSDKNGSTSTPARTGTD